MLIIEIFNVKTAAMKSHEKIKMLFYVNERIRVIMMIEKRCTDRRMDGSGLPSCDLASFIPLDYPPNA